MDLFEKPQISVPAGDPPAQLVVEDLVVGDGPEPAPGANVNVDEGGNVTSISDARSILQAYRHLCASQGLDHSGVIVRGG